MADFFNVLAPDDAVAALKMRLADYHGNGVSAAVSSETVATSHALGRITAECILAPEMLPAFARSTMDGYSVRAQDTFGATEGLPAYLDLVGEVGMGELAQVRLATGQTARAYTGGMLAHGADAVVQVERTQMLDDTTIEVMRPVAPGENVVQVGEDIRESETILPKGSVMRAQDIGGLLALGITRIRVHRKPRVGIISTGDELVPPDADVGAGQIRDINTYTIAALVSQAGGTPQPLGLIPDDFDAQRTAAARGIRDSDMLVFSAGSSVSSRDMTAAVIDSLGKPGVFVHGIAIKPGKPTIVGLVDGKPCIGLPGNPVSAMVVFDLVAMPMIYHLAGCKRMPPPPMTQAALLRDIPSIAGREDFVPVKLVQDDNGVLSAEPVFGKSNLIYTLVRSDGVVKVPMDAGGLYAGEQVRVRLYR